MNLYDFYQPRKPINLTENMISANDVESKYIAENLHKWFKEKWVRFGPDGKIRGDCARGDDSEGKPKCLPRSKAQSLGKKGRSSAARRKRREDPNPERSGKAINVPTKKRPVNEEYDQPTNDNVPQYKTWTDAAKAWSKARQSNSIANTVINTLPVVGQVASAIDTGASAIQGDYKGAGRSALGILPATKKIDTALSMANTAQKIKSGEIDPVKTIKSVLPTSSPSNIDEDQSFTFTPEQEKWLGNANRQDPNILARMPGPKPPPSYFKNPEDQQLAQNMQRSQDLASRWQTFRQDNKLANSIINRIPGVGQAAAVADVGAKLAQGDIAGAGRQAIGMIPAARDINTALQVKDVASNLAAGNVQAAGMGALGVAAGQGSKTATDVQKAAKVTKRLPKILDIFGGGNQSRQALQPAMDVNENKTPKQGAKKSSYSCPHCGGEMVSEALVNEKKDACYYKVKSRYKVWPSAYASGALVKCRKRGAKNWGSKSESINEQGQREFSTAIGPKGETIRRPPSAADQAKNAEFERQMASQQGSNPIGGRPLIVQPSNVLGDLEPGEFTQRVSPQGQIRTLSAADAYAEPARDPGDARHAARLRRSASGVVTPATTGSTGAAPTSSSSTTGTGGQARRQTNVAPARAPGDVRRVARLASRVSDTGDETDRLKARYPQPPINISSQMSQAQRDAEDQELSRLSISDPIKINQRMSQDQRDAEDQELSRPSMAKPIKPEIPSNVWLSGDGTPWQAGSGGYVTTDTPTTEPVKPTSSAAPVASQPSQASQADRPAVVTSPIRPAPSATPSVVPAISQQTPTAQADRPTITPEPVSSASKPEARPITDRERAAMATANAEPATATFPPSTGYAGSGEVTPDQADAAIARPARKPEAGVSISSDDLAPTTRQSFKPAEVSPVAQYNFFKQNTDEKGKPVRISNADLRKAIELGLVDDKGNPNKEAITTFQKNSKKSGFSGTELEADSIIGANTVAAINKAHTDAAKDSSGRPMLSGTPGVPIVSRPEPAKPSAAPTAPQPPRPPAAQPAISATVTDQQLRDLYPSQRAWLEKLKPADRNNPAILAQMPTGTLDELRNTITKPESGGNYSIANGDVVDSRGNIVNRGKISKRIYINKKTNTEISSQEYNRLRSQNPDSVEMRRKTIPIMTAEQWSEANLGRRKKLEDLTLDEVMKFQDYRNDLSQNTGAVGAWQFVNSTLTGLVANSGMNPKTTKFDKTTQDKLAVQLANQNRSTLIGNNIRPNAVNTYIAWYVGGRGAVDILNDSDKPNKIVVDSLVDGWASRLRRTPTQKERDTYRAIQLKNNPDLLLPNKQFMERQAVKIGYRKPVRESNYYFSISGTDKKTLITEFGMSYDRKGWYLKSSASPKILLDAYRAFGIPLKEEEMNQAAYSGTAATLGVDNPKSPIGSISKSQRLNKRSRSK